MTDVVECRSMGSMYLTGIWDEERCFLSLQINQSSSFSVASVFMMLFLDILFYAILVWYLDKASARYVPEPINI